VNAFCSFRLEIDTPLGFPIFAALHGDKPCQRQTGFPPTKDIHCHRRSTYLNNEQGFLNADVHHLDNSQIDIPCSEVEIKLNGFLIGNRREFLN